MRKKRILGVLAVLAILGMLAPPVLAQAPAPKVTYSFLIDQITSMGRNLYDGDFSSTKDDEWYARFRARPDFIFEVGRTKAVLGLEFDLQYGGGASLKPATRAGADLNTDETGVTELKWAYTEFDLTGNNGLLPFIPVETRAIAGAQPHGKAANYKIAYANGDFAGLTLNSTWAPNMSSTIQYVQVEEESFTSSPPNSGDDFALIFSVDLSPFKGLDLKPLYSYFRAEGGTSGSARRDVVGDAFSSLGVENRHTLGIDVRWKEGDFYFDPTFYYQTGDIDGFVGATQRETDLSAWLFDLQGGWRLGPLLLEARYIYSSGNEAKDDLTRKDINFFQPLNTDSGYYAGWANIFALGVDYFNGGGGNNRNMTDHIGYDRYGRHQIGAKATYSVTPALSVYGVLSPTWTAEKVDTDTPADRSGSLDGDKRYLGTEADAGLTYRFAPATTFDLVGAYLFAGSALDTRETPTSRKNKAEDAFTIAARVRFAF